MLSTTSLVALIGFLTISSAAPADPPYQNTTLIAGGGPPNLTIIAGGGPPNASLPPTISQTAVEAFQLVNYLENLESAFSGQGLDNLTQLWNPSNTLGATIHMVEAAQAQEAIHVQTAVDILNNFNKPTISPCGYQFPVTQLSDFLELASIITAVGIGAVIDATSRLALSDPYLVPDLASILSIEGRHDAYFRLTGLGLIPNPAPFDTPLSAGFALNLVSPFIVQGSCPLEPPFTTIPPMTAVVNSTTTGSSGPITFTLDASVNESDLGQTLYIGWVNQANVINYQPAMVVNGQVTSTIPDGMANLAFAALTAQTSAPDVNALTDSTIAGPAPVRIS